MHVHVWCQTDRNLFLSALRLSVTGAPAAHACIVDWASGSAGFKSTVKHHYTTTRYPDFTSHVLHLLPKGVFCLPGQGPASGACTRTDDAPAARSPYKDLKQACVHNIVSGYQSSSASSRCSHPAGVACAGRPLDGFCMVLHACADGERRGWAGCTAAVVATAPVNAVDAGFAGSCSSCRLLLLRLGRQALCRTH